MVETVESDSTNSTVPRRRIARPVENSYQRNSPEVRQFAGKVPERFVHAPALGEDHRDRQFTPSEWVGEKAKNNWGALAAYSGMATEGR
jgi:hypothetical protein